MTDTRAFTVLVAGAGLDSEALAALAPDPIEVRAHAGRPACVVIGYADAAQVRAALAAYPDALVLAVAPLEPAATVFAAGAAACVREADLRVVAAQLRALWRRWRAGQPQPGEGSAAVRRSEPDLPTGLGDRARGDRQSQP